MIREAAGRRLEFRSRWPAPPISPASKPCLGVIMLSPLLVALVALIYMLALFALAFYGDQRRAQGRSLIDNP